MHTWGDQVRSHRDIRMSRPMKSAGVDSPGIWPKRWITPDLRLRAFRRSVPTGRERADHGDEAGVNIGRSIILRVV
jgi:hypothetical protein